MSTATLRLHDPLLPPPPGGFGPGATLAFVAHGALLAVLALGVQWRASAPEVMSAELWSAGPLVAAPKVEEPAPPPPPPPPVQRSAPAPEPEAQIALERARAEKRREQERERRDREQRDQRERAERTKAERDKLQRDKREKEEREQKAAEARAAQEIERRREDNLKRMLGQAASAPANPAGRAAADGAPSRGYGGKLVAAIKPNIVFPGERPDTPPAEVEVRATATGAILSRRLVKSSGNRAWDEAVLRAIDRTERLPADTDGRVPSTLVIAFHPREVR